MIGLVVTGHGHFADGIHTSAQMIAGENEYVRYINFEEGMTPEQLAEKFNAAFDEFRTCDGVVVLSDLPGGSPFKTAVECKYARPDQKIEVISGTNLPMIVTAVTMLDMEDDPRSLAEELRRMATRSQSFSATSSTWVEKKIAPPCAQKAFIWVLS